MDYGALSNGDDGMALVYGIEPASPVGPIFGGYVILDWIGDWDADPGQSPGCCWSNCFIQETIH